MNDPQGCLYLGYAYERGFGVEKDLKKAFKSYELSCAGDNGNACSSLGILYINGVVVKEDFKAAHLIRVVL